MKIENKQKVKHQMWRKTRRKKNGIRKCAREKVEPRK